MGKAGDQPVMGERRRRREAERAAALAAEQAGVATPLTRRELRRRQLEEDARLEAIATGELQLGPAGTYELRQAAREAALRAEGPSAPSTSPASGTSNGSASETTTAVSGPSADSGAIATGTPSGRSVRERLNGPAERPDDDPAARDATATGRRPVVRTPTSATGIRRLDATGQLTGIQPAARPDDEPQHPLTGGFAAAAATTGSQPAVGRTRTVGRPTDANTGTSDPVQWDDAVTGVGEIIAVSPASARPAPASPSSPAATPSPVSPSGVPTADSPEDLDDVLPRPQWVTISSVSGASADEAVGSTTRRSLRRASAASAPDAPEPEEQDEDDDEHIGPNPFVTLIKIVTLALVAAIIGALIWLLATEAFDDSANGATPITTITTLTEETSAS